jgi:hypothetical protein
MAILKRNSRLFGDFEAELVDRHLHINQRPAFGKTRDFKIDVACLATDFPVERQEARSWLLAAAISAAMTALMLYLFQHDIARPVTTILAAVAALTTVVTLLVLRVRGASALLLVTRYSHQPLLRIRPFRRDEPDVVQFMQALERRIGEVGTKRGLDAEQLRSGEIRTLRRLCNEAVLTEAEYETAKLAVFNTPR